MSNMTMHQHVLYISVVCRLLFCVVLFCFVCLDYTDRRINLNLSKLTQSATGLKALKPAANLHYVMLFLMFCSPWPFECSFRIPYFLWLLPDFEHVGLVLLVFGCTLFSSPTRFCFSTVVSSVLRLVGLFVL